MKAFISYSLQGNDQFILTLLSFLLKEDNIDSILSQSSAKDNLDVTTKNLIEESSIFIGIALKEGQEEGKLLTELDYAIGVKIPCLLIVEDKISNHHLLKHNPLLLSRSYSQKTIYEIERLMNAAKDSENKSLDSVAWLISGKSIIAMINAAFKGENKSSAKFVVSGRLKLIEQQLLSIDSAAFQNLCDVYLSLREHEFSSINRTGSQFGKQKTIKGTPDTFFRLADGRLRYVEYTTQANGLVDKIKEDIDKCLDYNKTGVPANQVNKIIICFNSRITVAEETAITQHAVSKSIRIELIGLDWLALEIYSKYLILAKDILGIPLDTGQLLPLQNFIDEYNNKAGKLSTPLDNIFLHRMQELAEMESILATNDLIIISGFPGVGKTKLALEALDRFLSANKDYSAFAVSKKDQDISEDLIIHLQQEQNYVLLVDDANRQLLNFKQILGIFKEKRKGNIKLVITVRDYALNDVMNECYEFDPHKIVLKKFSDSEITDLINSDSFEIRNPKYQKRIVEVADGNARLAVMAARIAKQKQEFFLLGDVSDLYDSYFQTFIKDFDLFGNKILIKTLGIISFFFTIDRSNKEFIEIVLKKFDLDYHDFNEAIDELEKRELLEVQYNHARVAEQVMATYFFYKVFIKDETLSFKTLLFTFFPTWINRFSDTIIPSNNSFGYDSVLEKINGTLDEYLNTIYSEEEKVLQFFTLFWFYKREETLNYFHQKIKQFPEPEKPIYDSKYATNDFVWDRDKTLDFLANLFNHYTESFIPALELAFEYCRKKPESLPELIRRIRERLLFDDDDHRYDFLRQVGLFKLLISKFQDKQPHYVEAFFALAATFLSHHFQITKGGRNHSITSYQYPLPFYDVTIDFRKSIWTTLFDNYKSYPKEVLSILKNFRPGYKEAIPEILEFDLSFILPFIESNLDTTSFEHIHLIHEFVSMLNREKLIDKSYQNLKAKFNSKEYENFRKFDWNSFRGKQNYDFERYEDFQKLKEQDLRTSFLFKDRSEFIILHTAIRNSLSLGDKNTWGIDQSLNIILEENFLKNDKLGFNLLVSILDNYPTGVNPIYKAIKVIVNKSPEWALRFWNQIKGWKHEYQIYWQLSFFDYLPNELADEFYKKELLETINSISVGCYLHFESFEKFVAIDKDIILKILQIAVVKIENLNLRINLSYNFFEKYSLMLADNFTLLKKAYIQQAQMVSNDFDFNHAGLESLLHINSNFLIEYITIFYIGEETLHNRNTHNQFSFVWDLDNCYELIEEALNLIIESSIYFGILEHPIIIFFYYHNEVQKAKAKQFLLRYISKYHSDQNKMNAVFDVLRHTLKEFFEEAFLHYLSLNTEVENFKKIWWTGNGGTYTGEVNIGELHSKDWQNILAMVDKSKNQLDLIPIKTYIKQQIEYELLSGEQERKRKFIDPERW